ncbi:MAG TPA: hypothetical protein VFI02_10515 [Armatimonadota bacterium]|nr:hypothetical protein [Armatimonadota bacterium]
MRILCVADGHTGSRFGLTPPEHISPEAAPILRPMWDWWCKTLKDIGRVDGAVHVGDAVDGEGKKEQLEQLITDTKRQAEASVQALEHVRTKRWWFCYGTPFHTVGSYNYEEPVAAAFGASIRDTQLLEFAGYRFSFRHVVGISNTPYGQQTLLLKEALREQHMAEMEERPSAGYVVRAHAHKYCEAATSKVVARICPCFEVPGSVFGRRCRPFDYDMGLLLIETGKNQEPTIKPIIMPLKIVIRRKFECLK